MMTTRYEFTNEVATTGQLRGVSMPSFEKEFITIDVVLASDAEARGVDAFCLAWIKFERQLRELTTNLLDQA